MNFIRNMILKFVCSEIGDFIITIGISIAIILGLVVICGMCLGGILATAYITYGLLMSTLRVMHSFIPILLGFILGVSLFIFIIRRK